SQVPAGRTVIQRVHRRTRTHYKNRVRSISMAFKLPLFSRNEKDAAGQGGNASNDAQAVTPDTQKRVEAAVRTINPNATSIGDILENSGDIRLPLIGNLPLQQQVRILLAALGGSLILSAVFVWLNADYSELTSTQTQIAGDALMHSQRVGKATPNAIQGNKEA